jgi:23S rRNA G2445 N2-methylase RlmL
MNALVITAKGAEEIAQLEIKELLGCGSKSAETVVMFDAGKADKLDKALQLLAYKSQSASLVLKLLGIADINAHLEESLAAAKASLKDADFAFLKGAETTFRVNCERHGGHDYSSQDFAAALGRIIMELAEAKVSLHAPGIIIHAHIYNDKCYIGIDIAGFDLGKRDYKIFSHPSALNGITAYALLRMAGYGPDKDALLDPFCGSGTIPIEAALFSSQTSPHYYKKDKFLFSGQLGRNNADSKGNSKTKAGILGKDYLASLDSKDEKKPAKGSQVKEISGIITAFDYLLRHVIASKKNASIAGIEKLITFSKVEVEWLDTKVSEAKMSLIVTHPPSLSKLVNEKDLAKLYKEFLYEADYVLNRKGRILVVLQNESLFLKTLEANDKFKLVWAKSIWQGKQELKVMFIERK